MAADPSGYTRSGAGTIVASHRQGELTKLAWMLALGLALRLLLLPAPVHRADVGWFGQWAVSLLAMPFGEFYGRVIPDCDYLPGYLYLLALTARLAHLAGTPITDPLSFGPWIKSAPIAADLLMGVVVYHLARRYAAPRRALLAAGLVIFNPGLMVVDAAWGQVDSVGGVLALLSLSAILAGRPVKAALWAGIAFTVKPHYAVFLAVAGLAYLRGEVSSLPALKDRESWSAWGSWLMHRFILPVAVLLLTIQALLLPFSSSLWPEPFARWTVVDRLTIANDWFPVTTLRAFNLWGTPIAGWGLPDSLPGWFNISYQGWGVILFAAVLIVAGALAWSRAADPAAVLFACFLAVYASFELLTRIQDRYLFMAIPLLAIATALLPWMFRYYVATALLYTANVLWGYFLPDQALAWAPSKTASVVAYPSIFSVLLLLACLAGVAILMRPARGHTDTFEARRRGGAPLDSSGGFSITRSR